MNFLASVALGTLLANVPGVQSTIGNLWSKFGGSTVEETRENVVIKRYKDEVLRKLETLTARVEAERRRDECLTDADRVRRANPSDGSLASPGRFCE